MTNEIVTKIETEVKDIIAKLSPEETKLHNEAQVILGAIRKDASELLNLPHIAENWIKEARSKI